MQPHVLAPHNAPGDHEPTAIKFLVVGDSDSDTSSTQNNWLGARFKNSTLGNEMNAKSCL